MNGTTATNKNVIIIVVTTLAVNATIGLSTLAYCLVMGLKPDQVLLTAYISIITGTIGVIGGMLSKTSPTETTKAAILPSDSPSPVTVVNAPSDPVPTVETK